LDISKYISLVDKSVLVVDDNEMNLKVAGRMLNKLGVKSTLVDSGQAAIKLLESNSFDFILLDIQMPGLDGLETAKHLRTLGVSTPIIAYTAHALTSDIQKCFDAGMNEHLAKPVLLEQLADKLISVLSA